MLVPSRGGAADLALSQHWVAPGSDQEVGITSLNLGYAVTRRLRLYPICNFKTRALVKIAAGGCP